MRRTITLLALFLASNVGFSQIVNIPDTNFKNTLINYSPTIDTNNDGEIQVSEAHAWNNPITVSSKNISDLTGIEAFINIPILACDGNNLAKLDVSHNTKLRMLFCMYNQIEKLDVSRNTKLETFYASANNLKSLNIANRNNSIMTTFNTLYNPNLKCIQIDRYFSPLSSWVKDAATVYSNYPCKESIDPALPDKTVMGSTPLRGYKSNSSQIVNIPDTNFKNALLNNTPAIDINNDGEIQLSEAQAYGPYLNVGSKNINNLTGIEAFTNLTYLACAGNNLTKLNVSQNINLVFLYCAANPIEKLSLITNTKLENLSGWNCNLKTVNVANGNNSIITTFDVTGNPNLKCIQIDNGFTPNNSWNKDSGVAYSIYPCAEASDAILPDKSVTGPSPIAGYKTSGEIAIYPNPTKDILNIKGGKDIQKIEIYNLNAIKVLETTSFTLDVSKLEKGVYSVKIVTDKNKSILKKFVKE
ncbi:T9SS type A sorting domain-containing protein [Tenacibaculum aiptasiae]|uniref:T9SS type A sorting domain-containing protein n=1 Tax=Tenacibaculum aiptasiae TaxID=426481 RepID=UPI003B5D03DD